MAGVLSTEMAAGPGQPGIRQAPRKHEGLRFHPDLTALAPADITCVYRVTAVPKGCPHTYSGQQ